MTFPAHLLHLGTRLLSRGRRLFQANPDSFLARINGVIHIGANSGQERDLYARHGLRVVWVEPVDEVFQQLRANVAQHPDQTAYRYLIGRQDGEQCVFHISDNGAQSSSVFPFDLHREVWPGVSYTRDVTLTSITLPSMIEKEGIDLGEYDALVLDAQGSELLVLQGAVRILPRVKYIKTEVADFSAYRGSCTLQDIDLFLKEHGYMRSCLHRFESFRGIGSYYDVLYRNTNVSVDDSRPGR